MPTTQIDSPTGKPTTQKAAGQNIVASSASTSFGPTTQTQACTSLHSDVHTFTISDCPVLKFLQGLSKPCDKHAEVFYAMGICTEQDLKALAVMNDDGLAEVKRELLSKGLTVFEWVNIRTGLSGFRLGLC